MLIGNIFLCTFTIGGKAVLNRKSIIKEVITMIRLQQVSMIVKIIVTLVFICLTAILKKASSIKLWRIVSTQRIVIKFELEKCCFKIGGVFKTPVLPYTFKLSLIIKNQVKFIFKHVWYNLQRYLNYKALNTTANNKLHAKTKLTGNFPGFSIYN